MIHSSQLSQFQSLIQNASHIIVAYNADPTFDHLAVASALSLSLVQAGKVVTLASPVLPTNLSMFAGLEHTTTEIGNQNLTISFDYTEESVDKVSYHIGEETNKFYLTVKPKKGYPPLDAASVEFNYTGIEADLIITIGVYALDELEQLYIGYEDFYRNVQLVSITDDRAEIGVIALDTAMYSSMSEAVAGILRDVDIPVAPDVATNLLQAIEHVSNGFQSDVMSADSFEVVAYLLRQGGKRATRNADVFFETPNTSLSSANTTITDRVKSENSPPLKLQERGTAEEAHQVVEVAPKEAGQNVARQNDASAPRSPQSEAKKSRRYQKKLNKK